MRPAAVAILSLVSAIVGAAAVLLFGVAVGWHGDDDGGTQTVVIGGAPSAEADRGIPAAAAARTDGEFDPVALYGERSGGVVTIYAHFGGGDDPVSQGSGFVVSSDGYVLTNAHVITTAGERAAAPPSLDAPPPQPRGARDVFVEFKDGERVRAELIGWDIFDDVGVVRVDPKHHGLEPVPLGDSSRVVVGEPVAAIGSPFGEQNSLAVGVVSATRRSIAALTSGYRLIDAIQTDAPINRGNSGGPLFNARGEVIGINAQIRSTSGTNEGVGFAVPINSAQRSLEQLVENGRVAYAYVGVKADDFTPALAERLRSPAERGALIVEVTDGPARAAGLRGGTRTLQLHGREFRVGGDVVVAIDGKPVRGGDDLVRIVTNDLAPGQTATFTVIRDSGRVDVPVRLTERPLAPR